MAYRRSLTTTRSTLFVQRLFTPSISYLNHDHDRKNQQHSDEKPSISLQSRPYGGFGNNADTLSGFGSGSVSFRDPTRWSQFFHVPMTTSGFLLSRNMSTSIGDGDSDEVGDTFEYMDELADVMAEKSTEVVSTQAAPVLSEVAIAAADSWPPVAASQYAIDGIHTFTGLNWWACIVIITLIIRTLLVPSSISQMKASIKQAIMRPEMEKITQEIKNKRISKFEGQEQLVELFQEHGVNPLIPLKGIFIQFPVFLSFMFAIENMVQKVPSFKTGGALWFLDLTTADSFYVLPCLTAFTGWIMATFIMAEGLDPKHAFLMKVGARVLAALSIPVLAGVPKGILFYWYTSNLFSIVFGLILKQGPVKKLLNMPIIVASPPDTYSWEDMIRSWEETRKLIATRAMQQQKAGDSKPTIISKIFFAPQLFSQIPPSEAKLTNQRASSSSALRHRIKILEKDIKRRKKRN